MLYTGSIKTNSGQEIKYEVIDGRCIKVFNRILPFTVIEDEFGIIEQITADSVSYVVGEDFDVTITSDLIALNTFTTKYRIKEISERGGVYSLYCEKRTSASYFIFPLLFNTKPESGYDDFFINCYTQDAEKPEFNDGFLFLQYRFFPFMKYYELEKSLKKHPNYVTTYDPDLYSTMIVYKVDDNIKHAYERLIEGKYSQINEKEKEHILKFHQSKQYDMIGQVLYKGDGLRKQLELDLKADLPAGTELFSKPDPKVEWYRYDF